MSKNIQEIAGNLKASRRSTAKPATEYIKESKARRESETERLRRKNLFNVKRYQCWLSGERKKA